MKGSLREGAERNSCMYSFSSSVKRRGLQLLPSSSSSPFQSSSPSLTSTPVLPFTSSPTPSIPSSPTPSLPSCHSPYALFPLPFPCLSYVSYRYNSTQMFSSCYQPTLLAIQTLYQLSLSISTNLSPYPIAPFNVQFPYITILR